MSWLKIELTPEQEKVFEYRMYQFQGLQIAMNQFLSKNEFEYNEEHYGRLTDSYVEKFRLLSDYIRELLKERGYADMLSKNLPDYEYNQGNLRIQLPKVESGM